MNGQKICPKKWKKQQLQYKRYGNVLFMPNNKKIMYTQRNNMLLRLCRSEAESFGFMLQQRME